MLLFRISDEPSKPKTPEIIDYDNQSVTLKWTAPEKDGGAPIEKYFIEKKDRYISFSFYLQLYRATFFFKTLYTDINYTY